MFCCFRESGLWQIAERAFSPMMPLSVVFLAATKGLGDWRVGRWK
jgi:hypothetical protein